MNIALYKTKLQAAGDQPIVDGRTGIKYTLDSVTDAQIESMIAAGSKTFSRVDGTTAPAPVPHKKTKPRSRKKHA
jgi:hypothetical protein